MLIDPLGVLPLLRFDVFDDYYWPSGVPRVETIEAFIMAYSLLGYTPCVTADLKPEYEIIAI